jgi:glutathione S-transferase
MRIYYHPASTTSRTLMLFTAETGMDVEFKLVDIMSGDQYKPEYVDINPSRLVPVLEDGDFRLTESSAILKYLAEKTGSPTYPKELRARARVNEVMDWVNTQFCRDVAYGLVYPQIVPTHKRPSDELQRGTLAWAKERAQGWMKVLDQGMIGPNQKYLCGNQITIADYFASAFVSLAEFIRCDFTPYPNLNRWYNSMKALPSWNKVNEAFYGWAGSMKAAQFEAV